MFLVILTPAEISSPRRYFTAWQAAITIVSAALGWILGPRAARRTPLTGRIFDRKGRFGRAAPVAHVAAMLFLSPYYVVEIIGRSWAYLLRLTLRIMRASPPTMSESRRPDNW